MKHHLAAVALLSALAACAQDSPGDKPPQSEHRSLSAPTPEGVALTIRGADDGRTVAVKVGTVIGVELIGVPTAGYMWTLAEAPPFIEAAGEYGGPTSTAQLEPGFAGGSHWEAFLFNVTAPGEGDLRFEQRRPWEDDVEPPADEFSVHLVSEE